jgi:hypothetical protein
MPSGHDSVRHDRHAPRPSHSSTPTPSTPGTAHPVRRIGGASSGSASGLGVGAGAASCFGSSNDSKPLPVSIRGDHPPDAGGGSAAADEATEAHGAALTNTFSSASMHADASANRCDRSRATHWENQPSKPVGSSPLDPSDEARTEAGSIAAVNNSTPTSIGVGLVALSSIRQ